MNDTCFTILFVSHFSFQFFQNRRKSGLIKYFNVATLSHIILSKNLLTWLSSAITHRINRLVVVEARGKNFIMISTICKKQKNEYRTRTFSNRKIICYLIVRSYLRKSYLSLVCYPIISCR